MNLAFVPVYVSYLGIESYALIGIFAALQAWLALLDLGLSPTLTREMARLSAGASSPTAVRDLLRSVELVCLGIGSASVALMWGSADWLATNWLKTTLPPATVSGALAIMSVVIALRFIEALYRGALYGLEQQVWFNIANILLTTARFGGAALVITLVRPSIGAFFVWQLAVSVVAVAVLRPKLGQVLPAGERRARFSLAALNGVKRFAGGMLGINLTALVLTQADKVILSRMLPLGEFGYYTFAFTICSILYAVTGPIVQASYPVLVRAHAAGDAVAFGATYHRAAQLVTIAAASVGGIFVAFAPAVIRVWTGSAELAASAGPLLALLAAGTVLHTLMQIPYFGLLAAGETGLPLRANIVAATVLIAVLLLSVPVYGASAAAGAWLGINIAFIALVLPLLHRGQLRGLLRSWWLRDTGPVLAAAAGVCALTAWSARMISFDRTVWFAVLVVAGGLSLAAAIVAAPGAREAIAALCGDRVRVKNSADSRA